MKRRAVLLSVIALLAVLATAGYWLTTGPGRELLRVQAEHILTDLLEGEVRIARVEPFFHAGLGLRGYDVRVYPSDGGPGMRADLAIIEFREFGLLAADFELALLEVHGYVIRAVLDEDGVWSFPPLRALDEREDATPADPDEPVLEVLQGIEIVSRYILEHERIADKIVIREGRIDFEDRSLEAVVRPGTGLQRFQLDGIEARLSRPWPSDRSALALSGTFIGPGDRSVPVVWYGWRDESHIDVEIEAQGFDLNALDGYVQRLSPQADLDGTLTARVNLTSDETGVQQIGFTADLTDLKPTVVVDGEPVPLGLPLDRVTGRLSVAPDAARLADTRVEGQGITLGVSGRIERPIASASLAHLDAWIEGVAVDHIGPIIAQLPPKTVDALREWFDRLKSGTVDRLAVSGTTRASEWGSLFEGELDRLPRNFALSLAVSEVTAQLEDDDRVTDGSFRADWANDRLELRGGRGIWQGEELPEIDVTVDRFSRLVDMKDSGRNANALPTPGIQVLWDVLARDPDPESDDTAPTSFHVEIDYLDHPILRWPVEDAQVVVTPTPTGTEGQVLTATWGGQPIRAEVLYQIKPNQHLTVGLEAVDTAPKPVDLGGPGGAAPPAREWGRGRFDLEPYVGTHAGRKDLKPGVISKMAGRFRFVGSEAHLDDVHVSLGEDLSALAKLTVDLRDSERVRVDLSGRIVDASCQALGDRLGLPEGFITGTVDVFVDLEGHLQRDAHPIEHLIGTIHASAENGEIRQNVPLAVSLATATDGFNPFAKRETLQYDTIDTELYLQDGVLTGRRFELEGPVRIYATGDLDLLDETIDAVVGVFLLQRAREILGKIPLINLVLPGSKHGFVGAYFQVDGPVADPKVTMMAMKSLKEELPDLIAKPLDLIQWVWSTEDAPEKHQTKRPRETVVR